MRFCVEHQLARTRRVLAEVQADIDAEPKRKKRKFEPWQLRVAREWHERLMEKKAGTA